MVGNPFKDKDLQKDKHSLVPLPEEPPDEGGVTAALMPSKTINFKKPDSLIEEESKSNSKRKETMNINKVVDFYSSTFGDPNANMYV